MSLADCVMAPTHQGRERGEEEDAMGGRGGCHGWVGGGGGDLMKKNARST